VTIGASDNWAPSKGEQWSVRKVLRRMVSHELVHTKSIRRIIGDYEKLHAGNPVK